MVRVTSSASPGVKTEEAAVPAGLPEAPINIPTGKDVEFTTPSGKHIKLGKPPVPTGLLLPSLMSSCQNSVMAGLYTESFIRQMVYVREIDHKPTPTITEYTHVQQIALQLGEEGIDAVALVHSKYFPALTQDQLNIIKK